MPATAKAINYITRKPAQCRQVTNKQKKKSTMTKEKFFGLMGWVGTVTAILMYVFYFPQIIDNLNGHKGSFIQPFMAGINCTLWVAYGLFKEKRDWPVAIANTPGIIFGFIAAFTAL